LDLSSRWHQPVEFAPKAVFFDLDGTLIDSMPDIEVAIQQAAVKLGLPAPEASKVRTWIGNGAGALAARVLADSIDIPQQQDPQYDALLAGYMHAYGELKHAYSSIYPGVKQWLQTLQ
ncbi:MAG TPA: hypothetical protein DC023_02275, partial [Oceanospirillaceae bacterium]|nr:hypothetical protein [Oceanospirillaceae bacterium]